MTAHYEALAISFQIFGRSYYRSYEHAMQMRSIVKDGRSKAKYLRQAIHYQKKSAEVYASARTMMERAKAS